MQDRRGPATVSGESLPKATGSHFRDLGRRGRRCSEAAESTSQETCPKPTASTSHALHPAALRCGSRRQRRPRDPPPRFLCRTRFRASRPARGARDAPRGWSAPRALVCGVDGVRSPRRPRHRDTEPRRAQALLGEGACRDVLAQEALLARARLRRFWPVELWARALAGRAREPTLTMEEVLPCLTTASC